MKTTQYTLLIVFVIFGIVTVIAFTMRDSIRPKKTSYHYSIDQTWHLPTNLDEVSGIAYVSGGTIACVQDEDGIIFMYDLNKNKITRQIKFAGPGDYEGIAIHNKDAYIMRSDGIIFEIKRFLDKTKEISSFATGFSYKNNMETLVLDAKHHSLITSPKDRDKIKNFKGLYQIDLDSKTINATPFIKIYMDDKALKSYRKKKVYKTFNPSDIAIHPISGDYYVLEGRNPKLLIMDQEGIIKKLYKLDHDQFPQPEGITFSPEGTLYISNEAHNGVATIVQVSFD